MAELNFSGTGGDKAGQQIGTSGLGDLAVVIKRQWISVFVCIVLGFAVAMAAYVVTPEKWTAFITVKIGKIPQKGKDENMLIESVDQFVARVGGREFQDRVLGLAKIEEGELTGAQATLFRKSFLASSLRNSDFVQISFSAKSQDYAKTLGAAITQSVLSDHKIPFDAVKARLKAQLDSIAHEAAIANDANSQMQSELSGARKTGAESHSLANVTLTSLLVNNMRLRESLRATQSDLERDLSITNLYATTVTAVHIDDAPFPKAITFAGIGIIFGLILGVLLAMFRTRT
ncbi:hypothetical protein [Herbaspirillum sp. alder98]|uniref:hypothetical protein n=1 Tax=Herbaspirillum sp. alder98 TaxID=2913096 RepID=UPI001CD8CAC5|nr:hypothetical protein [Herbaspirillum sp. alder98]MCA1324326.1 hypothetical protein [Herbaspirillum sp. alder98]